MKILKALILISVVSLSSCNKNKKTNSISFFCGLNGTYDGTDVRICSQYPKGYSSKKRKEACEDSSGQLMDECPLKEKIEGFCQVTLDETEDLGIVHFYNPPHDLVTARAICNEVPESSWVPETGDESGIRSQSFQEKKEIPKELIESIFLRNSPQL